MKQDIENIIKKNFPEIKEHICRFNDGECVCDCFKECISQINTSLIADEVLKVVVEKIKEQKQKYIENDERDGGGWQDEIHTCKKIIKLLTLSLNKEE